MVVVKRPSECSPAELQDFASFVLAGGEVEAAGLDARIRAAEALCFLSENGCLKGIAAIKRPYANYRAGVFNKAKAAVAASDFSMELGWVFVLPSARGSGLSSELVQAAITYTGSEAIYATSQSERGAMHKSLCRHGFQHAGEPYASERGDYNLLLFVRSVAQPSLPADVPASAASPLQPGRG